nr:type II toxin-antitoxin system RelE/ParE family toxin [Acidisoma sp. PAMC 29798]
MTLRGFSRRALAELDEAAAWIAHDNPDAADTLITLAIGAAKLLAENPRLGRLRPDLAPAPYRFWPLRGFQYVFVYDAEAKPPLILRVIHQARDLPDAML